MLRLLAAFMICILVLSHGSMGVAAPHGGASFHSHVGSHDADPQAINADHHDAVPHDVEDSSDANESADYASSDAAHAHPTADRVPSGVALPAHLPADIEHGSLKVTRLSSTAQPPLLEPPSA